MVAIARRRKRDTLLIGSMIDRMRLVFDLEKINIGCIVYIGRIEVTAISVTA